MFRLFSVLPFVFILISNFGASHVVSGHNLINDNIMYLMRKVSQLETKVQGLTNRMNGATVHCENKVTYWAAGSERTIMYLDRQDVDCPRPYFLARFRLGREGSYSSARVRYSYRCCRFVL